MPVYIKDLFLIRNIGDYYKVLDDPLYGKNPENHDTITNALGRSIRFYGKGGRLSKRAIKIYL